MTKQEIIKQILKTYDSEMIEKHSKWLNRQSKSNLETILRVRKNKEV